jgi:hypothetical protein
MSNPPSINFTVPFAPVALRVVVNANGVLPDGTNVPSPDVTSPLVFTNMMGPTAPIAAVPSVDPLDNRRVIITPGLLSPGPAGSWNWRISAAGRSSFVTISGTTAAPVDASGVVWDGSAIVPA